MEHIETAADDIENTMEPFDNQAAPDTSSEVAVPEKKARRRRAATSEKEEAPVCPICCETYNKSLRAQIICSYEDCHYSSCKTCVRTYLTSTIQEPHCMNCKKPFDDEFMFKHLNKSYCKTDFRDHRRKILFDIEVSKIPDTIPAVEKYLKIEEFRDKNREIDEKIADLERQKRALDRSKDENYRQITILRGVKSEEKRKFIMACPNHECRGFLSTSYKCELCKNYTCPHCLELIGTEKPRAVEEGAAAAAATENPEPVELEEGADAAPAVQQHVCNPDCVKNAEAIKKDTRACPSCGTRIYKIEGCSQIWCTSCHVAFDWNTGRIDNGVIHNPHFFEWQRKGGGAARVAGAGGAEGAAAADPCAHANNARLWDSYRRNIFDYTDRWMLRLNDVKAKKQMTDAMTNTIDMVRDRITLLRRAITRFARLTRTIEHVANVIMAGDRHRIDQLGNHDNARVLYILKRMTDEDFANLVYKNSVMAKKLMEKYHVYELMVTVAREWFNAFVTDELYLRISNEIYYIRSLEEIQECVNNLLAQYTRRELEITEFVKYCNEQFHRIGVLYNERVYYINLEDTNDKYDWKSYRPQTKRAAGEQSIEAP